jgi:hypothetical protein
LWPRNTRVVPNDSITTPGKGTGSSFGFGPGYLKFHLAATGVWFDDGVERGTVGILGQLSTCDLELGGIYWFTEDGGRGGIDDL